MCMHSIKELKPHMRAWMLDFLLVHATGGNASQGWALQVLTLDGGRVTDRTSAQTHI